MKLALALLLLTAPARAFDGPAWTLVHAAPADFKTAEAVGLSTRPYEQGLWGLAPEPAGFASHGTLTSQKVRALLPFDELVLSWNAKTPPGTALSFEVQPEQGGRWGAWYKLGVWSSSAASIPGQKDSKGEVAADTLVLAGAARAFRYRVTFDGDGKSTPLLRLLAVAYDRKDRYAPGKEPFRPGPWVRELDVPLRSQRTEPDEVRHDICSPVSLGMAAAYLGDPRPSAAWVPEVRDHSGEGLYGNWPFNVAAAAERGLEGWVARLGSMEELQEEIAAGRPAVASITFKEGELRGAPMKATHGHLIVVRGFTADGDVIVGDPAGLGEDVRRVYKRKEFELAWLLHKRGLIYRLGRPWPKELYVRAPWVESGGRQLLYGQSVRAAAADGDQLRLEDGTLLPAADLALASRAPAPNAVLKSAAKVGKDGFELPAGAKLHVERYGWLRSDVLLAEGRRVSVPSRLLATLP